MPADFTYRGYRGVITEMVTQDGTLTWTGHVTNLRDVVTFVGEGDPDTIAANTEREFRASVDDYLEMCKERGEEPERPTEGTP